MLQVLVLLTVTHFYPPYPLPTAHRIPEPYVLETTVLLHNTPPPTPAPSSPQNLAFWRKNNEPAVTVITSASGHQCVAGGGAGDAGSGDCSVANDGAEKGEFAGVSSEDDVGGAWSWLFSMEMNVQVNFSARGRWVRDGLLVICFVNVAVFAAALLRACGCCCSCCRD